MNRRYQVFVSSTSLDLKEERREVIEALLSMDCIPAGMELFPAADDDQFTLIKRVIDQCDYYIVILAGRYGSVHPTEGKSYTRLEYEYAVSKKKPTIAFLHSDPGKLAADKSETDPARLKQLNDFRELAKTRLCKYWDSKDSLVRSVFQSLFHLIRDKPAGGWVRADEIYDETAVLKLKNTILKLENDLQPLRSAGLVTAVMAPYTEIDWSGLFRDAKRVDLLFAYARTWRWSHTVELRALACSTDVRIRVVLPDPDCVEIVGELARRFNCEREELRHRVREAAADFLNLKSLPDCKAEISVWFYPFAPQYSMHRFDDAVVISMYSHRATRAGAVTFLANGGSLGGYMADEFETLIRPDGKGRLVENLPTFESSLPNESALPAPDESQI